MIKTPTAPNAATIAVAKPEPEPTPESLTVEALGADERQPLAAMGCTVADDPVVTPVAAGLQENRHAHRGIAVHRRRHVVGLRAELHARDIAQPHDGAVPLGDDEILELLGRPKVGVREQAHLHEVALRLADRGEIVVALERCVHIAGRQAARHARVSACAAR